MVPPITSLEEHEKPCVFYAPMRLMGRPVVLLVVSATAMVNGICEAILIIPVRVTHEVTVLGIRWTSNYGPYDWKFGLHCPFATGHHSG